MRISDIQYNKHTSEAGFSSINDIISDTNEKKHDLLLNAALDKLWSSGIYDWTYIYTQDDLDIIEHRDKSYKKAPVCIFRTKKFPYKQWKVDMDPYWNNTYIKHYDDVTTINFNNYEDKDKKVTYADYVNGKVKMESKLNGTTEYVSFERTDGDINLDTEEFSIKNTLTYMIESKEYGKCKRI